MKFADCSHSIEHLFHRTDASEKVIDNFGLLDFFWHIFMSVYTSSFFSSKRHKSCIRFDRWNQMGMQKYKVLKLQAVTSVVNYINLIKSH